MKIICTKCKKEITPENINVQNDYAVCKECNIVFKISDYVRDNAPPDLDSAQNSAQVSDLQEKILHDTPKGTWVYNEGRQTVIGASKFSPVVFFLIPFMLVWSGFSLRGIYGSQIKTGEFNLVMSLFGLPFLAGTFIILGLIANYLFGKVVISIGSSSYFFNGVGAAGRRKKFDWNSVIEIHKGENYVWGSRYSAIFLKTREKEIKINTSMLNYTKKNFLYGALKYLHQRDSRYRIAQ